MQQENQVKPFSTKKQIKVPANTIIVTSVTPLQVKKVSSMKNCDSVKLEKINNIESDITPMKEIPSEEKDKVQLQDSTLENTQ